ncbi:MAG: DUF6107 family protein, partial [Salaquimonas sp.]
VAGRGKLSMTGNIAFYDLPEAAWLWVAKGVGAVLGSAISIAYVLPKGRREAAIRFITGVILGISFGPTSGAKIASYFDVSDQLSKFEIALMGATAASLCAWWALGLIRGALGNKIKLPNQTS